MKSMEVDVAGKIICFDWDHKFQFAMLKNARNHGCTESVLPKKNMGGILLGILNIIYIYIIYIHVLVGRFGNICFVGYDVRVTIVSHST